MPPLEAVVKDDFADDLAVLRNFSGQRKRVAVSAVGGVAIGALLLARGTSAKCDYAHQHQNCRCQKSLHLNRCRRIARTLRAIFASYNLFQLYAIMPRAVNKSAARTRETSYMSAHFVRKRDFAAVQT